ncbi:MAG: translation initiation factor IF-2 [Cytophagales bacterium]
MSEEKGIRLSQAARQLNVGVNTVLDFLKSKGYKDVVDGGPNAKINHEILALLTKEYQSDSNQKKEASTISIGKKVENITLKAESTSNTITTKRKEEDDEILIKNYKTEISHEPEKIETKVHLSGPKILGKIDLNQKGSRFVQKETEVLPKIENESTSFEQNDEITRESEVDKHEEINQVVKTITIESEKIDVDPIFIENVSEDNYIDDDSFDTGVIEDEVDINDVILENSKNDNKLLNEEIESEVKSDLIEAKAETLKGLTVLGKIQIPTDSRPVKKENSFAKEREKEKKEKKKRKRLATPPNKPGQPNVGDTNRSNNPPQQGQGQGNNNNQVQGNNQNRFNNRPNQGQGNNNNNQNRFNNRPNQGQGNNNNNNQNKNDRPEISEKEIQDKLKDTLAKIGGAKKEAFSSRAKFRKEKRQAFADAEEERLLAEKENAKVLKLTEFISTSDLASLMSVSVNEVISTSLSLGIFVSINQRLDAELITVLADEFGYSVEFISAKEEDVIDTEQDNEDDLEYRPPIVTIMGHVDHGKTSLLDYIRRSKVVASEAGGITQHIGAYDVTTDNGKKITFLDTPGHEAFTAMRARGAKITDIAIIVIAADDSVMPQTKEAINHAQVAQVPIVIALNKIDKPNANPDKVREELAQMNILVEEWGGKYQCQEISAKSGKGIPELLEKVLLEAELLELKANPNKKAVGTVIEASLDKGRGYVATLLVEAGTLRVGDIVLAGKHFGRVKAMMDHTGKKLKDVGPSGPVQVLGLDGAPQAGDKFNVMDTEREAREIANRREQILREQSVRTKKHITLDEIGRRLAIGNFQELNIIIKGDVDGSVEALSDSLLKLSTDEIRVNILHKGVGQISESDVLLASASDAIIVAFQVRPSQGARKLAENEQIEIRMYSIIYDVINDVRDAMEGMLAPKVEEVIVGNVEVREVFKISKVGTIAGCYVSEGYVKRNNQVRLIRDGIVVYTGDILALKRFKDDVTEVKFGYECGLSLKGFNDIQVGDTLESFELKEVKRKL